MTVTSGRNGRGRLSRSWLHGLVSAAVLVVSGAAQAQPARGPGEPVDAKQRAKMVEQLAKALNAHYVFPEVAKKMEASLRQKLRAGAYDKLGHAGEFAAVLTSDLQEVSKDKHLSVHYAPTPPPRPDEAAGREERRRQLASLNFGFAKVERLAGNVGYLDLRAFVGAEVAGETAVAAMNFLAHSDALIIDLRQNGGGEPSMIQLITSYFFAEPTHLNSFYIREGNTTEQFWTSAHVSGKRMTDVPIYVLTSKRTFSAAEEFSYNLKNLKRATLVGETTGGGAHPVKSQYLGDVKLLAFVPFGRAVNPITGTNWEGTGVAPDLQVPAEKALEAAHVDALKKLRSTSQDGQRKQELSWALQGVEARATPVTLNGEVLKSFAGSYGTRTLAYENGSLWYQWRPNGPRVRAFPMKADTLMLDDGMDILRLRIEKDAAGKVSGLTELSADGRSDTSPRTGG